MNANSKVWGFFVIYYNHSKSYLLFGSYEKALFYYKAIKQGEMPHCEIYLPAIYHKTRKEFDDNLAILADKAIRGGAKWL